MIEGIVGLPGSGKTYLLAKIGIKEMKKGRKVYTNFKLEGAYYFSDILQLVFIRDGVILIDEVSITFPSRKWDKFPDILYQYMRQTRKFGLDMYWTAQSADDVDVVMRRITNYIRPCRKLAFGFHFFNSFEPTQLNKEKRKGLGVSIFRISPEVYERYNTWELIEIPEYLHREVVKLKPLQFIPLEEHKKVGKLNIIHKIRGKLKILWQKTVLWQSNKFKDLCLWTVKILNLKTAQKKLNTPSLTEQVKPLPPMIRPRKLVVHTNETSRTGTETLEQ